MLCSRVMGLLYNCCDSAKVCFNHGMCKQKGITMTPGALYTYMSPSSGSIISYQPVGNDVWQLLSSSLFLACNSRLRSTICRPHLPHGPVLRYIHCFRQCEIMGSQILLYDAQPCDVGRPRGLLQSSGGRVDGMFLASVLSSIKIILSAPSHLKYPCMG